MSAVARDGFLYKKLVAGILAAGTGIVIYYGYSKWKSRPSCDEGGSSSSGVGNTPDTQTAKTPDTHTENTPDTQTAQKTEPTTEKDSTTDLHITSDPTPVLEPEPFFRSDSCSTNDTESLSVSGTFEKLSLPTTPLHELERSPSEGFEKLSLTGPDLHNLDAPTVISSTIGGETHELVLPAGGRNSLHNGRIEPKVRDQSDPGERSRTEMKVNLPGAIKPEPATAKTSISVANVPKSVSQATPPTAPSAGKTPPIAPSSVTKPHTALTLEKTPPTVPSIGTEEPIVPSTRVNESPTAVETKQPTATSTDVTQPTTKPTGTEQSDSDEEEEEDDDDDDEDDDSSDDEDSDSGDSQTLHGYSTPEALPEPHTEPHTELHTESLPQAHPEPHTEPDPDHLLEAAPTSPFYDLVTEKSLYPDTMTTSTDTGGQDLSKVTVHYSSGDSEAVTISSSPDTVQPEVLSLGNTETDVTDETKQSQQNTPIANTEATELETSSSTTSAQDSHVINADQFDPEVIQASCDKVVSSSSRNDATTATANQPTPQSHGETNLTTEINLTESTPEVTKTGSTPEGENNVVASDSPTNRSEVTEASNVIASDSPTNRSEVTRTASVPEDTKCHTPDASNVGLASDVVETRSEVSNIGSVPNDESTANTSVLSSRSSSSSSLKDTDNISSTLQRLQRYQSRSGTKTIDGRVLVGHPGQPGRHIDLGMVLSHGQRHLVDSVDSEGLAHDCSIEVGEELLTVNNMAVSRWTLDVILQLFAHISGTEFELTLSAVDDATKAKGLIRHITVNLTFDKHSVKVKPIIVQKTSTNQMAPSVELGAFTPKACFIEKPETGLFLTTNGSCIYVGDKTGETGSCEMMRLLFSRAHSQGYQVPVTMLAFCQDDVISYICAVDRHTLALMHQQDLCTSVDSLQAADCRFFNHRFVGGFDCFEATQLPDHYLSYDGRQVALKHVGSTKLVGQEKSVHFKVHYSKPGK